MNPAKQTTKCKVCKQYITDDILYKGDLSGAISESAALEKDTFCLHRNHGVVGDKDVPSFKVTSFTICDRFNHLCPIDSGLIDKGTKLYFSGFIKTVDDEDPSVENGTLVSNVGPISEWWIYGYDGTDTSIIGLTTEHALYYLMQPSQQYADIFKNLPERTRLSKLVIEFLLDFGSQNPTFEDLIEHLKNFKEFSEVEELLFREAQFLCNQVISYDEETTDEEIPMISYTCIQTLIELTGVTIKRSGQKTNKGTEKSNNSTAASATTTNLVRDVFQRFFLEQSEIFSNNQTQNGHEMSTSDCDSKCENIDSVYEKPEQHQSRRSVSQDDNKGSHSSLKDYNDLGSKPVKHKECSKQIMHTVKWLKKSSTRYNDCQGYSSACVEDFVIHQGDHVMLQAEDSNESLRIAIVSYLYDSPSEGAMFHAHFFCRGTDTILGKTANPRELFVVDDCDDYPVGCIIKKAEVKFYKWPDNWANLGSQSGLPIELDDNGNLYFFSKIYDYEFSKFRDYNIEHASLDSNQACLSCRWQKEIKDNETPAYKDNFILWRKEVFKIGSAVFLEPGQTKYIPEPVKEDDKYNIDTNLYPEMYRKKVDVIRGSNLDTPEPFTVGLIEEIKNQKNDIKIKVRMFYRPEDTQGSLFWSYGADVNYLYWTHDVIWTTFKNVAGKCYVTFSTDIKLAREWSYKGPYRFYYSEAYNHKNFQIFEVPIEGKISCNELKGIPEKRYELRSNSKPEEKIPEIAPKWAQIDTPLRCMDIYAGCGGLSAGLHQSGVANTLWAIEKEVSPAQAFQLNNPKCHVYTEDCNDILKTVLSGKGQTSGLPDKGDVELLIGGPPCQGFSAMNRYSDGQYSFFNNSQITTFLSYCDYYRPKYLILENVRNFVSFKKGTIFKLTLKSLLAIGYQISFGILQGGHFGIPQTRRRFILIGAAPGSPLPSLPEPLHVFSKSGTLLSIVVDGLRYDTGSHWTEALPYRTICIRDAIADLPEIENGGGEIEMRYDDPAKSHFQKNARNSNENGVLKEHICKELSLLVEARIANIPTYPGADWRDLPNKVVKLKDGSLTNILHYRYRKRGQNKIDPPRGVCKCSTGSTCDPTDRQSNTLIPWCLSHTADRHNNWVAVYGRLEWDGYFGTTVTNPEPMGTQGRVLHPEQNRVVSVRECARSQGFQDNYKFSGTILDKHRQIGNAVPPPLALCLGREIIKVHNKTEKYMHK